MSEKQRLQTDLQNLEDIKKEISSNTHDLFSIIVEGLNVNKTDAVITSFSFEIEDETGEYKSPYEMDPLNGNFKSLDVYDFELLREMCLEDGIVMNKRSIDGKTFFFFDVENHVLLSRRYHSNR